MRGLADAAEAEVDVYRQEQERQYQQLREEVSDEIRVYGTSL